VSDNLSEFILTAVVCSAAVYDFEASYVTGSWLQLSTHTCSATSLYLSWFSVSIQEQFFPVFQLFAPEVKYFHQKNTWV